MGQVTRIEEVSQDIFGTCGLLKTDKVKITLQDAAIPHCVTTCRRILFPIMDKVKAQLDRMESACVICKVTEPTDWCSLIMPVIKKNGKVIVCIDMKTLNQSIKRPHYMLPNREDIMLKLIKSKFFSTDALVGFFKYLSMRRAPFS